MNTPTPEDSKIAALRSANSLDEPYTREIASSVTKETFANDPLLGVVIAERYSISSVIGVGGWSVVYQAFDSTLNRPIAMKALHSHLCVDQAKLQRFQREAESASKLSHPNIAVIYDLGELSAGRPFISMELIEGVSLSEMLQEKGHLAPEECISLFSQICDGLEAIHKLGLIHRDLKPSNIKVSVSGAVKILDFGLAKWILQEQSALTRSDESLGTPTYMSPEQCLCKELDARSDVYALGCMMYEALTGAKPFVADNSLRCMQMHVQMEPPRFRTVNQELKIPRFLELAVFKALAKDPRERFASAAEMKAALHESEYSDNSSRKFGQFVSWHLLGARKHRRAILAATLALLAGLVGLAAWQKTGTEEDRADKRADKRADNKADVRVDNGTDTSQTDVPKAERTIPFPHEVIGDVFLLTRSSNGHAERATKFSNVKGPIVVPTGAIVELANVPAEKAANMEFLDKLQPKDVQYITLSNKGLTDKGLERINRLKGLEDISLDDTEVTDAGLEQLDLPLLGGLNLRDTAVTDKSIPNLASKLFRLKWFSLHQDHITDQGAATIFKMMRVTSLDLTATAITDACLKDLNQPKLKNLQLAETKITDAGVYNLANCKSLKLLTLNNTKITDQSVKTLVSIKSLKELNVSQTLLSEEGIKRLKKALPDCIITGN
jgi:serine/threonine protein kinase